MVEIKPFGSWESPITAESLTSGAKPTDVCVDKDFVYWTEVVPSEEGRGQIFCKSLLNSEQKPKALLPLGYNCRTRVHEYGGGSFTVKNGLLVFSNNKDSRLYTINLNDSPSDIKPLTKADTLYRYADIFIDQSNSFLVCVREEHFEKEEPKDVLNVLVSIDLKTKNEKVVAQGADFYSCPRFCSANNSFAYISWDHPNMPWDFTRLHYAKAEFEKGELNIKSVECIAGEDIEESIAQLKFGIDGTLYFTSDRTGFWNLYSYTNAGVELLFKEPLEQEYDSPAWRFNESTYVPFQSDAKKLVCINKDSLAVLDTEQKTLSNISLEKFQHFSGVCTYSDGSNEIVIANMASTTESQQLLAVDIKASDVVSVLKGHTVAPLDSEYISVGKEITFPTTDGKTAYCYFYEPKNPKYKGEGLPPVRVLSHGGPTTQASNAYNRAYQYWTSRGFALIDVNYGGSSGYGRTYRNRLLKKWGIVDVDDCCHAALYLADKGLVDREKLAIEGGSAGGFTTLASVAFRDVFKAGCCKYGISDITLLAKETHKFESRYPDRLIGEYPKDKDVYEERSPLFSADKINCPVIFFQGAEDKVVPPSQSEVMVKALKEKGIPVAYVLYEGEAHGFRRAENIKRTMEVEQWFYGQIFGFPVEGIEGVEIYNYPKK